MKFQWIKNRIYTFRRIVLVPVLCMWFRRSPTLSVLKLVENLDSNEARVRFIQKNLLKLKKYWVRIGWGEETLNFKLECRSWGISVWRSINLSELKNNFDSQWLLKKYYHQPKYYIYQITLRFLKNGLIQIKTLKNERRK